MKAQRFLKNSAAVTLCVSLTGCATIDEGTNTPGPAVLNPTAPQPTPAPSEWTALSPAPSAVTTPAAIVPDAPAIPIAPAASAEGWETIGYSVEELPIRAKTFGTGPHRVLILGPIHGNEKHGLDALRVFLAGGEPLRIALEAATVRVIENPNPDGLAANTRGNSRGVDLNRNFPARNFVSSGARGEFPLSEPESAAVMAEIKRFKPEAVVALHSLSRGRPLVNYDGPAVSLAGAFASAAVRSDKRWYLKPDMGYPTPGSLGSWLGVDQGVPVVTIEFSPDHDPQLAAVALSDGLSALAKAVPSALAALNQAGPAVLGPIEAPAIASDGNGKDAPPVQSGK